MILPATVDEIVRRWRDWAVTAMRAAAACRERGDVFGAHLRAARGAVRRAAADLLRGSEDPDQAARAMLRRAVECSVRTSPLIGYDQAAISYTSARTWQACARELNPDLPEVQQRWP